MPFTISCSATGANCPASFVSGTQVQLLEKLQRHIDEKHPELATKPPPTDALRKRVKKA